MAKNITLTLALTLLSTLPLTARTPLEIEVRREKFENAKEQAVFRLTRDYIIELKKEFVKLVKSGDTEKALHYKKEYERAEREMDKLMGEAPVRMLPKVDLNKFLDGKTWKTSDGNYMTFEKGGRMMFKKKDGQLNTRKWKIKNTLTFETISFERKYDTTWVLQLDMKTLMGETKGGVKLTATLVDRSP